MRSRTTSARAARCGARRRRARPRSSTLRDDRWRAPARPSASSEASGDEQVARVGDRAGLHVLAGVAGPAVVLWRDRAVVADRLEPLEGAEQVDLAGAGEDLVARRPAAAVV